MQRVILHCDMNNFYASVECMLNPELKNKPVAVCGSVEERHGIVLAKNYAAKAFGVSTGEAIWQAKQKCQDLVIVEPHYEQYMKFSKLAREIYGRYTDQIEPYGMDECWLDVTGSGCMGTGFEIADEIRRTVKFELGLSCTTKMKNGSLKQRSRAYDPFAEKHRRNRCCSDKRFSKALFRQRSR